MLINSECANFVANPVPGESDDVPLEMRYSYSIDRPDIAAELIAVFSIVM